MRTLSMYSRKESLPNQVRMKSCLLQKACIIPCGGSRLENEEQSLAFKKFGIYYFLHQQVFHIAAHRYLGRFYQDRVTLDCFYFLKRNNIGFVHLHKDGVRKLLFQDTERYVCNHLFARKMNSNIILQRFCV